METPLDERHDEQDPEQLRQEIVTKAIALLEKSPEYPGVLVQIHDSNQVVDAGMSIEAKERLSEARLEYLLKFVQIRGEAYSRLVTDLESVKAFTAIMDDFMRLTWMAFAGFPFESVQPTSPFADPHAIQSHRDKLVKMTHDLIVEGYRRLADLRKASGEDGVKTMPTRRGYRQEIQGWMERSGLDSQRQAARRLGVSIDVLKSIMSNKGRARYSPETLAVVLEKIGHKPES
jgi:hypothetical protein